MKLNLFIIARRVRGHAVALRAFHWHGGRSEHILEFRVHSKSMGYQHDIFASYTHDSQMGGWVAQHLVPFLETFVGNALNRPIRIFLDRKGIEAGDSWPARLQNALATSRCLVAVWAPLYFHSEWCRRECATILNREQRLGFRTVANPKGLIIPIKVFDGDFFPQAAKDIQGLDFHRYWIAGDGFAKTERYVEFQDVIKTASTDIAQVISAAPPWQQEWLTPAWLNVPDGNLMPPSTTNFEFTGLE